MKVTIEIDEKHIAELVSAEIAKRIVENNKYEGREAKYGIREGTDKAIKKYIYENKDEIIERIVGRASVEMVRKGLPKLLEKVVREEGI